MFFVLRWNRCYQWKGLMTLVVDCKHTGCFSCYVETNVIMGGWGGWGGGNDVGCWLQTYRMFLVLRWNRCYHGGGGWGGWEVMTLVVDCKHRGCFSCYVESLVFQWAWRQHVGPCSPPKFLKELENLLKTWKPVTTTKRQKKAFFVYRALVWG